MADPITWKNVEQSPYSAYVAGNLLKSAGDSFSGGIDKLTGIYDQFQKDRSSENTAAYEAELAKYTTPEALKAAQDSGVFAKLGGEFGIQMNPDVLRNGVRNADTRLVADATNARNYQNQITQERLDPFASKLKREIDAAQVAKERGDTTWNNGQTTFKQDQDKAELARTAAIPVAALLKQNQFEAQQDKVGTDLLGEAFSKHRVDNAAIEQTLGRELETLKLPVLPDGRPDLVGISSKPEWAQTYSKLLKDRPELNQQSDTKRGNEEIDRLRDAGQITPRVEANLRASLGKSFDSSRPLVGRDVAILQERKDNLTAQYEKEAKANSLFLLPKQGLDRVPEVIKAINEGAPDVDHQKSLQQVTLRLLQAGGINIGTPEKPQIVPLSLSIIQGAAAASNNWFSKVGASGNEFWGTKTDNYLKQLKDLASSPEYIKQAKHAEQWNPDNLPSQLRLIKNIVESRTGS